MGDNAQALASTIEAAGDFNPYWEDIVLPLFSGKTAGLTLTGGTTPIVATASSRDLIRWAAGDAADLTYNFVLPGCYDQERDALELLLLLLKSTAGNAGTATINAAALLSRDSTSALAGDSMDELPTSIVSTGAATISDLTTPVWHKINFDIENYTTAKTTRFQPLDVIQLDITPGAHDTAVIDLYGVIVRIKRKPSLFDATHRYAR